MEWASLNVHHSEFILPLKKTKDDIPDFSKWDLTRGKVGDGDDRQVLISQCCPLIDHPCVLGPPLDEHPGESWQYQWCKVDVEEGHATLLVGITGVALYSGNGGFLRCWEWKQRGRGS